MVTTYHERYNRHKAALIAATEALNGLKFDLDTYGRALMDQSGRRTYQRHQLGVDLEAVKARAMRNVQDLIENLGDALDAWWPENER